MTVDRALTVLRAHALHIIACVLLGTLIGLGAYFLLPRTYESQALLWVASTEEEPVPGAMPEDRMATYLEYARSARVSEDAAEALADSGAAADPAEDVVIANPEGSAILTVTGSAADPEAARALTDAVAEAAADRLTADDPSDLGTAVEIAQQATLPQAPVAPFLLTAVLAGALGGAVLGVLLALVLGSRRPRLYTADSVGERLGARVVGSLGGVPNRRARRDHGRSGISDDPVSAFTDLGLADPAARGEIVAVVGADVGADPRQAAWTLGRAAGDLGIGVRVLDVGDLVPASAGGQRPAALTADAAGSALESVRRTGDLALLVVDDLGGSRNAPALLAAADSAVCVYGAEPLASAVDAARERMRAASTPVRGAVQSSGSARSTS